MSEAEAALSPKVLLDEAGVADVIEQMAAQIAPLIDDDWICMCLLTGGLWFAADLTRALSRKGCNPLFDALWIASYGDARRSRGEVDVLAGLQRDLKGRSVLLLDDVFDSGLSLRASIKIIEQAGAKVVKSAVFARKPWPEPRGVQPDFVGWEAPARFLVGYGMDDRGRYRGLPGVAAVD